MQILKRAVEALLSGGWTGSAADGFAHGWEQWHAGATEVLDALRSMGHLLGNTGRDYDRTDDSSAEFLHGLGVEL